jgi:hypothetical protein
MVTPQFYKEEEGKIKMNNYLCRTSLYYSMDSSATLSHHGILGMHWGIRRFQPYSQGYDSDNGGVYVGPKTGIGKALGGLFGKASSSAKKAGSGYAEAARMLGDVGRAYGQKAKSAAGGLFSKAKRGASDFVRGASEAISTAQKKGAKQTYLDAISVMGIDTLMSQKKKQIQAGLQRIDDFRLNSRRKMSDINEQFNGITPRQALQGAIRGIGEFGRESRSFLGDINQGQKKKGISPMETIRTSVLGREIDAYRKSGKAFKPSSEASSLLGQLRGINEAASNLAKKRESRESTLRGELADRDESRIRDALAEIQDYRDPKERKYYDSGAHSMSKYASSLLSQLSDINQTKKVSSVISPSSSGKSSLLSQLSGIDQTKKLSDIGWFDYSTSKKSGSSGWNMGSGGFKISF